MTLTNYWWLLIWLFIGGALLTYIFPKRKEMIFGNYEKRWNWLPALILIIPFIIWAAYRPDNMLDTGAYRNAFSNAPESFSQIESYLKTITKDKGFYLLMALIKCLFGSQDVVYFLLVATFQIVVLVWLFRKYSCNYWLSIFFFVASTDYISWIQNGIRQFMAVTIILLATTFMIKRKYMPAILLIFLATTMHQSAILMLAFMLIAQGKTWNKRTMLFLLATMIAIIFVGRFTDLLNNAMQETQYANMVSDWTEWGDNGTNPLRVLFYSLPTVISLLGLKYIKRENNPVINFCTNMSIISTGLYLVSMVTSGIFIGRLPIYASLYNYILLPWEIEHMFNKESAKMIRACVFAVYCGFFYYQMHVAWGLI